MLKQQLLLPGGEFHSISEKHSIFTQRVHPNQEVKGKTCKLFFENQQLCILDKFIYSRNFVLQRCKSLKTKMSRYATGVKMNVETNDDDDWDTDADFVV